MRTRRHDLLNSQAVAAIIRKVNRSMAGKSYTTNEVILEGRLGRDPEIRFAGSGIAIATISIATDDGTPEKPKTNFHAAKAFGALAEEIAEFFRKGDSVLIRGRLDNEKWEDRETGKERTKTVVLVNAFYKRVWGRRSSSESSGNHSRAGQKSIRGANNDAAASGNDSAEDDVPF